MPASLNLWRKPFRNFCTYPFTIFCLGIVLLYVSDASAQDIIGNQIVSRGEDLFNKSWNEETENPGWNEEKKKRRREEAGPLGPMFNARSCRECHHQGGSGGGGDNRFNVFLLTLRPGKHNRPKDRQRIREELLKINHGFIDRGKTNASIILHHFSTNPEYASLRANLLGIEPKTKSLSESVKKRIREKEEAKIRDWARPIQLKPYKKLKFTLTQRNTPALFGVDRIDDISFDDINAQAKLQAGRRDGISGRVPLVAGKTPGRFGWRGQMATSRGFVLTACAVELGLQVKDKLQSPGPSTDNRKHAKDLDDSQTSQMVAFVKSLPPPKQKLPEDSRLRAFVRRGEQVFGQANCSVCHVKDLGPATGIYSDLLLHDMGPALSDPVAAPPIKIKVGQERIFGGYMGTFVTDVFEDVNPGSTQEWKTPPLWGVADSPPYLHDGRAKNLRQAIALHAGEASDSVNRFNRMTDRDKAAIIAFLKSLRAPDKRETFHRFRNE